MKMRKTIHYGLDNVFKMLGMTDTVRYTGVSLRKQHGENIVSVAGTATLQRRSPASGTHLTHSLGAIFSVSHL